MHAPTHRTARTFPDEAQPLCGYWVGKTVSAPGLGGTDDIGIQCEGDDYIFTRPRMEVAAWIIAAA